MSEYEIQPSKLPQRPKQGLSLLWLVGGLVLGIGATKAVLMSNAAFDERQTRLQRQADRQKLAEQRQKQEASQPQTTPGAEPPTVPAPTTEADLSAIASDPNVPIAAGIIAPPSPLQGGITGLAGGSVPPVSPIVVQDPRAIEAAKEASYTEVTIIVPEADIDSTASQITALAKSFGASVQTASLGDDVWLADSKQLILSPPIKSASQLESEVLKVGSAQATDRWTGPFSERRFRMERFLRDAKFEFESRIRKLLIKYLEDAPEVVRAQEQLDQVNKALASLKPVASDRAAIRVFVGKKPIVFSPQGAGSAGT